MKPVVLLRNAWQTENIGDIAHTPGMLRLLAQYLPEVEVVLWAGGVDRGVGKLLLDAFPNLGAIIEGEPSHADVQHAFRRADVFLHGSGSGLVAMGHLQAWLEQTGKPAAVLGITVTHLWHELVSVLHRLAWIGVRESRSLELLEEAGIEIPRFFFPDTAFSCDLRDDSAATEGLAANRLSEDGFLCVVPRLRHTPYHTMRPMPWSEAKIAEVERVNADTAEPDHAVLRRALVVWVESTGRKVLLCPEMSYQTEILRPLLFDPLPEAIRRMVSLQERYWLTPEAAAVYSRAAAVLSMEMHSPILALGQGTPAILVRQPTDTHKGQMWRDLGLADWMYEVDQASGAEIGDSLVSIASGQLASRERARTQAARARHIQASHMHRLRSLLQLPNQ